MVVTLPCMNRTSIPPKKPRQEKHQASFAYKMEKIAPELHIAVLTPFCRLFFLLYRGPTRLHGHCSCEPHVLGLGSRRPANPGCLIRRGGPSSIRTKLSSVHILGSRRRPWTSISNLLTVDHLAYDMLAKSKHTRVQSLVQSYVFVASKPICTGG